MLKRRVLTVVVLSILALCLFTSSCQNDKQRTLKVGCIFPLTGSGSLWGQNSKKGVELAAEEINQSGGISGKQIEVLFEDSQTQPKDAVSAFRKLVDVDGVKACIVDMISGNVLAVAPIANEKRVPILSPGASSPDITDAGDYVFRNWPSDALQGEEAARIAYNKLGWKRAGVFYINNEYGNGLLKVFSSEFEKLGGKAMATEAFQQGGNDFKSSILKLKTQDVDGIYLAGYPQEVPLILKQSHELNLNKQFLGTETFEDPGVIRQAGPAADGVLYLLPQAPNTGRSAHFKDAFKKKFNEDPGVPADAAYDALYIFKLAIEKAGYDGSKIKDQLYNVKGWEGASGITTFDANGDAIKPYDLKTIKDGKFVVSGP